MSIYEQNVTSAFHPRCFQSREEFKWGGGGATTEDNNNCACCRDTVFSAFTIDRMSCCFFFLSFNKGVSTGLCVWNYLMNLWCDDVGTRGFKALKHSGCSSKPTLFTVVEIDQAESTLTSLTSQTLTPPCGSRGEGMLGKKYFLDPLRSSKVRLGGLY